MSFFSKIFKKKKGGTMFGNLLRGASSMATGGILGSGIGLAKSDAQFEQKEYSEALQKAVNQQLTENNAYKVGKAIGTPVSEAIDANPTVSSVKNQMTIDSLKKNKWYILGGLLLIVAVIYLIVKPKGGKRPFKK